MIHVAPADEPPDFDEKVRKPGHRALAEGADPLPPYWREASDDLMAAYRELCAYSCFRIHPVTGARSVDHFAAKSLDRARAYEWSNYRLCSARLNSRKRDFSDVLDPFEIGDDWFHLELVGFQVLPNFELPPERQAQVQASIQRLGLNDFRRERERNAQDYWNKDCSLKVLRRDSPFVANELKRQGRLNPGDVW